MYYTRNELFKKYEEHDTLSKRYFHKSCDWRRYTKEQKENYWKLYQKHCDIAYYYLSAVSACDYDGVLFVGDEEFK